VELDALPDGDGEEPRDLELEGVFETDCVIEMLEEGEAVKEAEAVTVLEVEELEEGETELEGVKDGDLELEGVTVAEAAPLGMLVFEADTETLREGDLLADGVLEVVGEGDTGHGRQPGDPYSTCFYWMLNERSQLCNF